MAKILFITDELPFPPRNGVTIPAFYFLKGLAKRHQISLLFLRLPGNWVDNSSIEANRQFVKNLFVLKMTPSGRVKGILKDFFCQTPYFARHTFDPRECTELLGGCDYDALWATPIGPFAQMLSIEICLSSMLKSTPLRIAAISDSYTCTLRSFRSRVLGVKWPLNERLKSGIKWIRSWSMAVMEARILMKADHIIVQSKVDKEWILRISKGSLSKKIIVLPNGVNSLLLGNRRSCEKPVLGHIGSLSNPLNSHTVKWIFEDILPDVRRLVPEIRFAILGNAGSPKIMRKIFESNASEYTNSVEAMKDFYRKISVLLIRNYRCFGLINRTVEAMAAGVVVIGERGAFNGIEGFRHGVHGFVAESTQETVECLVKVLSNESVRKAVSHEAQNLIQLTFRWADRIALANTVIENSLSRLRHI
ncbi:MAG: glycosyltransferase family 4 protein [Deltaproteobacteria bacterium]|nr:glycosyltransferase family 4 protein [Deltaproteobacteria bacterium]